MSLLRTSCHEAGVVVVLRAVEAMTHGFDIAILGQRMEVRAAIFAEALSASAAVV